MTFRPDRDKLNAHFEGYRLGRRTLTCVTQSFAEDVRVARLKGDDLGYQHVRAFTLHNYLATDPWDGHSVYWCTSDGAILRGRYLGSSGVKVNTVFQCPAREDLVSPSINPSVLFITSHLCLFTTGASSSVNLLHTPSRGDAPSDENEEIWKLLEELKLPEEEPFSILSASYSETEHQLNLVTMTLQSAHSTSTKGKEKTSESKPPIAMYNWYRCDIHLHSSPAQPSSSQREKEESVCTEPDLVCSLKSSTVALYGAFALKNLIILSEADVLYPSQPAATEKVEETEKEGETERPDSEQLTEEIQAAEGEGKKFSGLGFEGKQKEEEEGEKVEGEKVEGEKMAGEKREEEGEREKGEGEKMAGEREKREGEKMEGQKKEEEGEREKGEGEKMEGEKREEEGEKEIGEGEKMAGEKREVEGEREKRERGSEEPQYQWSQTEGDVAITVPLPDDVSKRDIHCEIHRREIVVGLSDGTTFLRGVLFSPISPDCSTWTVEKHTLEVSLEKEREGEWECLLTGEADDEGESSAIPLRGPFADQLSSEELETLRKRIDMATNEGSLAEAAANHHSLVQGMFYEECDINDEDATFYNFAATTTTTTPEPQRVSLAGRQFLFSSPSLPRAPPLVCLKHDVDAVLWQPETPPTSNSSVSPLVTWKHVGTFNALAYVQAARQDKKFTVCPPNMKFAALCDCRYHVFVYLQPREGVKGNSAAQYITTLKSQEDILGLGATDCGLVFVLKEHELHVIVVQS